ncbi:YlcI/YnfO family protein [Dyella sp.]|uniref:YlcI/YnfO family protein n=1 Tax=Dyella sp. TaxID=1869338 RepID=UPI002B48DD81|nr:YlcI/YnfO family protein [Dyella sp.]HKT29661.1 YlcI/YnfO family protein [Dyella sp.]
MPHSHPRQRSKAKTSLLPSVRVDTDLRRQVEKVMAKDESLSNFIEASVRAEIQERQAHRAFLQRGLRSKAQAELTGVYYGVDEVMRRMDDLLAKAQAKEGKG